MPFLIKLGERDEIVESGSLAQSILYNEDGTFNKVVSSIPEIGCSFLVGSVTARSYSSQDYWITTPVTEILETNKTDEQINFIRFKTKNSEYVVSNDPNWRAHK